MSDGVDHINIYSKGITPLGRALSNFFKASIQLPEGHFSSIEGYWYWLNSNHPDRDKLRNVHGWSAKKLGRELKAKDWNDDPTFKLKIIVALSTKLISHPDILQAFKENDMPFRHYYNFNGKIVEPIEGKWIVEYFEYLRIYLNK